MNDKLQGLLEYQSGGYPLNTALILKMKGDDEPTVGAFFDDAELDVFFIKVDIDGYLELPTNQDTTHFAITKQNLENFKMILKDGRKCWEALEKYADDDEGTWVGWEHMITQPKPK